MPLMKTDVIHLDSFDDIDSIRDRLEWSKADRVVLVWPRRGGIEIDQLEMVLLIRKARQLGRQIAIVSGDREILQMAGLAGISTFQSQASATLAQWPLLPEDGITEPEKVNLDALHDRVESLREQPSMPSRRRLATFAAGVAAIFLLLLFFLPGATIRVFPAIIDQTLNLTIEANPDIRQPDIAGHVPLLSMSNLQTASDTIVTSGNIPVADQYASGQVELKSLTGKATSLPPGSIVTTLSEPVIRFQTLSKAEVPSDGNPVAVEIRAVLPGSAGNLPSGQIQSFEGSLGPDISVINDDPTTGGGESSVRSPSEDDIQTLREKVKSLLLSQASQELYGGQKADQLLLEDSLKIEKIIDEEISTPAGQPADTLQITLTGEMQIKYILDADILTACREALNANIPDGYYPSDETISLTMAGEPQFDRNAVSLKWEVRAARTLRSGFSSRDIVQSVAGKTTAAAMQRLSGMMDHRSLPIIEISPSWWPRLPFLPFRIAIEEE